MIYTSGPRPWRRYRFDGAQVEMGPASLPIFETTTWKTTEGLAKNTVKTVLGLDRRESIKTFQGLT